MPTLALYLAFLSLALSLLRLTCLLLVVLALLWGRRRPW
jgi:hypothetical protein